MKKVTYCTVFSSSHRCDRKHICSQAPRAAILAFSMHLDPVVINTTIQAGATGYLLKDAPPEELARAVVHVRAGRRYMDRQAEWISRLP